MYERSGKVDMGLVMQELDSRGQDRIRIRQALKKNLLYVDMSGMQIQKLYNK